MIIFDTNKQRVQELKKILKKVSKADIDICDNELNCITKLQENELSFLWIGSAIDAEYLIHWIISMQPSIRHITLYDEHNKDNILKQLRQAQYRVDYINYDILIQRLNT